MSGSNWKGTEAKSRSKPVGPSLRMSYREFNTTATVRSVKTDNIKAKDIEQLPANSKLSLTTSDVESLGNKSTNQLRFSSFTRRDGNVVNKQKD